MVLICRLIKGSGKYIFLLLTAFAAAGVLSGQPVYNHKVSDTMPLRKSIINKQITVNPKLAAVFNRQYTVDTVGDLTPYLQSKKNCDFERTVDSNGCFIVRYTDGLTKKICGDKLTEVITPDGKKHVLRNRNMSIFMYVMPIPTPPNPGSSDTAYNWLISYNDNLMNEIEALCSDDKDLIAQYTANENAKCNGSLYREIEYRTIFIEEFLKAR